MKTYKATAYLKENSTFLPPLMKLAGANFTEGFISTDNLAVRYGIPVFVDYSGEVVPFSEIISLELSLHELCKENGFLDNEALTEIYYRNRGGYDAVFHKNEKLIGESRKELHKALEILDELLGQQVTITMLSIILFSK